MFKKIKEFWNELDDWHKGLWSGYLMMGMVVASILIMIFIASILMRSLI